MAFRFHHELLARVRIELGLSQEEAARAVGVDVRTYRRYESGEVNGKGGREPFEVQRASRRKLLDRIVRELGIAESELLVPLTRDPPAPPLTMTLPKARHFVGRVAELARIAAWLEAGAPILAVVALGGAGKTSLVERAIDGRETFVHAFYDEPRVDAFLDAAADALEGAGADPLACLLAGLRAHASTVLVLDGLEVLQASGEGGRARGELEDPRLVRLFRAVARGGAGRLLVTSRFPIVDVEAETLALPPLDADESRALLAQWGLRGPAPSFGAVHARTGGHALSVAVTGSYAASFLDGDLGRLGDLALGDAARDEPLAGRLQRVLERYAADLAPLERDLLAHVCLFPRGMDAVGLARLFPHVADAERNAAMGRLVRRGLATRASGDRISAHPFLREHFKALVVDAPAVHARERKRVAADLVTMLEGKPLFRPEGDLLDACEALFEHTLFAGDALAAYELLERSMGGFAHLGLHLGDFERGLRLVRALDGQPLPRDCARRVRYDRGLYRAALGDLDGAIASYRAVLADDEADPTTHRTLAYTLRLSGDLTGARRHVLRSIALAQAIDHPAAEARGHALRGAIATSAGDHDEAAEAFARCRSLGDTPTARRGLWEAEHRLAVGDRAGAKALTEANLAQCERRAWDGHAAQCMLLLGHVALQSGDLGAAEDALARADEWIMRSREVETFLAWSFLAIDLANAQGTDATALVHRARDAAIAGNFGLAVARLSGGR